MKRTLTVLVILAAASVASANMLSNPSFEDPFTDAIPWSYDPAVPDSIANGLFGGVHSLPGWLEFNMGHAWAPDGVDNPFGVPTTMSASDGGGVYGNINTHTMWILQGVGNVSAGDEIQTTFDVNYLGANAGEFAQFIVVYRLWEGFIGGPMTDYGTLFSGAAPQAMDTWLNESVTATMEADGILEFFVQKVGTGGGFYVDNFDMQVVPEPATMGLFAVLGGAMLWIRKRF